MTLSGRHSFTPAKMVSLNHQPNRVHQSRLSSTTKIVFSLFAFLGFLGFLLVGAIYMSDTYEPDPKTIVVRLHSLIVQDSHGKNFPLLAKWDAKLTIENKKEDLKIHVGKLESVMYYKGHAISCSYFLPLKQTMAVESMQKRLVNLIYSRGGCGADKPFLNDRLQNEMMGDRKNGRLRLSLKMKMVVSPAVIQSQFLDRFKKLDVRCLDNLEVHFGLGERMGRLVGHDLKLWNCTLS